MFASPLHPQTSRQSPGSSPSWTKRHVRVAAPPGLSAALDRAGSLSFYVFQRSVRLPWNLRLEPEANMPPPRFLDREGFTQERLVTKLVL